MGGLFGGAPVAPTTPAFQSVVPEPTNANDAAAQEAERKRILQERSKYNQNTNILTGLTGDTTTAVTGKKVLTGQ